MPGPPIGEAFVRIRPDFSQFAGQVSAGVGAAAGTSGVVGLGRQSKSAATGVKALTDQSNLLRGSIIGISRITPVAVFGLGLIGTAAIAATTAVRTSIVNAAGFEQQLNIFQATAEATAEEMDAVAQEARDLGKDLQLPAVSSIDAAVAMTELARAGLSVQDSISGARGVLQLATAANIDAATSAQFVASTLNAFSLSGEQAAHVADLLAAASVAAQGSIGDMALAFSQSQAVAEQVGITVEELTTHIAQLAHAGLIGSDAGTAFRTTMLRLTPTTKEAANFVDALGIRTTDASGAMLDAADIFEQYRVALEGLTDAQQQLVLAQIFGQDAIRAVAILARDGRAGYDEMAEATNKVGAAQRLTEARARGLAGAWNALISNAETLGTTLGQTTLPALTEIVFGLSGIVTAAGQAIDAIGDVVKVVRGLSDLDIPPIVIPVKFRPDRGGLSIPIPDVPRFFTESLPDQVRDAVGAFHDLQEAENRFIRSLDSERLTKFFGAELPDSIGVSAEAFREAVGDADKLNTLTFDSAAQQFDALDASQKQLLKDMLSTLPPESIFRAGLSEADKNIQGIIFNIESLTAKLQGLRRQGIGPESTAFQEFEDNLQAALRNLAKLPGGLEALRTLGPNAAPILADSLSTMVQQVIPGFRGSLRLIPIELENAIKLFATLGPGAKAQLNAFGMEIAEQVAQGVRANDRAIEAAEDALADAIAHRTEAIRDAVSQARGFLESEAETLISQVEEIIDAMPFGVPQARRAVVRVELQAEVREAEQALREARASGLSGEALQPFIDSVNDAKGALTSFARSGKADLETVQDALDALQARLEQRRLDFNLRQAQRELQKETQQIVTVQGIGVSSVGQRAAVEEFLDPFRESVAEAEGARKVFSLEQTIRQIEDAREAAKKTAREGIAKLVDQFQKGRLSADEFRDALKARLRPELQVLNTRFGKNLGLQFTQTFLRTLDNVVNQAKLLTGFLDVVGAAPGQKPVDVGKVVREEDKRVRQAAQNLRDQIDAAKRSANANEAQVRLLALILATLKDPTPKSPVTKADVDEKLAAARRLVTLRDVAVAGE